MIHFLSIMVHHYQTLYWDIFSTFSTGREGWSSSRSYMDSSAIYLNSRKKCSVMSPTVLENHYKWCLDFSIRLIINDSMWETLKTLLVSLKSLVPWWLCSNNIPVENQAGASIGSNWFSSSSLKYTSLTSQTAMTRQDGKFLIATDPVARGFRIRVGSQPLVITIRTCSGESNCWICEKQGHLIISYWHSKRKWRFFPRASRTLRLVSLLHYRLKLRKNKSWARLHSYAAS